MFYSGCREELRRGYEPVVPLLMLLGGSDDWTPPQPCQAMVEASALPKPELVLYPGVYHGFTPVGTEPAMIINAPTELYNYEAPDEFRLPFDDASIGYDWSVKNG